MNLLYSNDRPGELPPSLYAATTAPAGPFPPLRGATKAQVCVVGGGFTGLSAALHLAERGVDTVLLEAHRVGFGASGRNGGQVGSGMRLGQKELESMVGEAVARRLWAVAEAAKALTRTLADRHADGAEYKPGVAHACWSAAAARQEWAEAEHLARAYDYDQIETLTADEMAAIVRSPGYCGGIIDWGAGHIQPLAYATGLARAAAAAGVRIFEMSPVHHIRHGSAPVVQTDRGRVDCTHVVLACNGYLRGLDRHIEARVMPINNFVVATEPLGERADEILARDIAVADSKFVVNYFRLSSDRRLVFGGGESYGYRFPKDIAGKVRKPLEKVFPQLAGVRIDYAWGGTLAVTMTRLPTFARPRPNVWSASGYSGHGVALAGMAGKIIADAIAGESERFDLMAGLPVRRFPGGPAFSHPLLVLAMTWYALRDRLGL